MSSNTVFYDDDEVRKGVYSNLMSIATDPLFSNKFFGSQSTRLNETYHIKKLPANPHFLRPQVSVLEGSDHNDIYSTILIGEIDENMGTKIGALGDWSSDTELFGSVVTDRSSCRNAYALRMPSGASDDIADLFLGQISEFDTVGVNVRHTMKTFDVRTPVIEDPPTRIGYDAFMVMGVPIYRSSTLHNELSYHRLASALPIPLDRSWQQSYDKMLRLRGGWTWGKHIKFIDSNAF
ncbi:hypothetical protein CVT24_013025 [Panaeolus cyanescens]|uniref:Uncharacterized protein n=1 Tax=Panaeolus cyanescens TaxID=181874 RepID=A0A409WDN7_9AGAR|nr:hypothetical protein CVT24_013025 [Panaeolus cyanescens]